MKFKSVFSIFLILMGFSAFAQENPSAKSSPKAKGDIVTDTFTVAGVCGMCKKRIEASTDLKGVKSFSWSPETRLATVSYRSDKVSVEEIKKAIVAVGHDVPGYTSTDKAYGRLPDCCKHREVASHSDSKK